MLTPHMVHYGLAADVLDNRQRILQPSISTPSASSANHRGPRRYRMPSGSTLPNPARRRKTKFIKNR